ncbi:unnamed protein product [Arabidopsis lyrata]|nr:unnamed protein product [Arabidopsis lyrata]
MNSCSFTLFILGAIIFLRCLCFTGAATCHPDDEAGLLGFKSSITKDPSDILSSWKKGTNCCFWRGIICFPRDRVTQLNVNGDVYLGLTFLSGTISPMLAKLQHLEGIYLTSLRKIAGPFPQFLFRLPKLKYVSIQGNLLSGPLPANIGELSQLKTLVIEGNLFTGQIPSSISNLTRFFGKLPPSIASLAPTLTYLDLSQNNLSGTIPEYLSRFKALSTLVLSKNHRSITCLEEHCRHRISGFVVQQVSPENDSKIDDIVTIHLLVEAGKMWDQDKLRRLEASRNLSLYMKQMQNLGV